MGNELQSRRTVNQPYQELTKKQEDANLLHALRELRGEPWRKLHVKLDNYVERLSDNLEDYLRKEIQKDIWRKYSNLFNVEIYKQPSKEGLIQLLEALKADHLHQDLVNLANYILEEEKAMKEMATEMLSYIEACEKGDIRSRWWFNYPYVKGAK